ncbi:RNA polymerase II transcription factor B subunit 1 [Entomophthora muscae]|uniref:RNA polymerase II transcription factor B subunit 1 n=1 Tax=Entomophthora muscae TaxID=34485 RepID=A0ACC2SJ57_9FUNG|nr:RNA polymerase II transcription factor B subunit 1 [Entomophthora muscae]
MVKFAQNEMVIACSTPVIYLNQTGTLYFTSRRLAFVDEKTQDFTVSLLHTSISKQLVNPEKSKVLMLKVECIDNSAKGSSEYKFAFKSETASSDRTAIKEAISNMKQQLEAKADALTAAPKPSALAGADGSTQPSNSVLPGTSNSQPPSNITFQAERLLKSKQKISDLDARIRCTILKKAPKLAALHHELVLSGVVSEEEFWENRQYLLRNQAAELTQTKAQTTAWIDIKPSAQEGNEIKYTLTPELIHDIFLQHPSVQKAYDENVPDKLSEELFWKRFFSSKYFHRNRSVGRVNVDTEDDIFDKLLVHDDMEAQMLGSKYNSETINPALNLFSSEQDHGETGNEADFTMRAGRHKDAMSLIRRFNYHSEQVIRNAKPNPSKAKKAAYSDEIIYEDLAKPTIEPHIPLDIQNQSALFSSISNQKNSKRSLAEGEEPSQKRFYPSYIKDKRLSLQRVTQSSEGANKAAQALYAMIHSQRSSVQASKMPADIKPATMEKLNEIKQTGNEILRHFWACNLSTEKDPERAAAIASKRSRMIQALQPIQEKLQKFLTELRRFNEPEFTAARKIVFSLVGGIKCARDVYQKSEPSIQLSTNTA